MSGMDNANDHSSVNNASGYPPVASAPATSDAPAPPLAANAPPVKVGDYVSIIYKELTKGDGTWTPCDEYAMLAKVISVDPEKNTFVAEGVFAAGAFDSTSVEMDEIAFDAPDWSPVPEVAGMSEGERIAFFYDKLKKFYLDTVYKHDTPPSCAFLKMGTSRGPLLIQVSPGAKPCRIILNGAELPIATPFDVNQFVAEKFGGDVGAAPSVGTKRPGSGSAQMDSGACIELEDLQKHKVTFLGYKRGTGIDWWVRLDDGREGWARDDDIAAALPEEQIEKAEKELGLAKAAGFVAGFAGPSHLREKDLPSGWHREQRHRTSGGAYHVYRGPGGLRARSVPDAWRKHDGEVFEDGDKDEVTLPDHNAATEVDEMLDVVMRAENRETPSGEAMATEPLAPVETAMSLSKFIVTMNNDNVSDAMFVANTAIASGQPAFERIGWKPGMDIKDKFVYQRGVDMLKPLALPNNRERAQMAKAEHYECLTADLNVCKNYEIFFGGTDDYFAPGHFEKWRADFLRHQARQLNYDPSKADERTSGKRARSMVSYKEIDSDDDEAWMSRTAPSPAAAAGSASSSSSSSSAIDLDEE